jgi:hypothetical protein
MALNLTAFAADLAMIEADLPQTLTIGGTAYPCVAGGVLEGADLGPLGFDGTASVTVFIRKAALAGVVPYRNQTVTLTSQGNVKALRINDVTPAEDGVSYMLALVDPSK